MEMTFVCTKTKKVDGITLFKDMEYQTKIIPPLFCKIEHEGKTILATEYELLSCGYFE